MAKSRKPKKSKHHNGQKPLPFFGLRFLAIVMFAFL
jgi:hypothetical protein